MARGAAPFINPLTGAPRMMATQLTRASVMIAVSTVTRLPNLSSLTCPLPSMGTSGCLSFSRWAQRGSTAARIASREAYQNFMESWIGVLAPNFLSCNWIGVLSLDRERGAGAGGAKMEDRKFLMAGTKVVIPTLKANAHCGRKKLFLRPQRTHRLEIASAKSQICAFALVICAIKFLRSQ